MGMIKILIVEDDDSIAGLMRMTLCKNGYHVETAPDGPGRRPGGGIRGL